MSPVEFKKRLCRPVEWVNGPNGGEGVGVGGGGVGAGTLVPESASRPCLRCG